MEWKVDPKHPTPIYAQLMEAIRHAVATGRLVSGEQLPTVRQLSVDLKINPNTVARAYSELERAGLIATRQGRGTFVLEPSAAGRGMRDFSRLAEIAKASLVEANALGFSSDELLDIIRSQIATEGSDT